MCVCVCVCICAEEGGGALGLSLLKSYTSGLVIWEGCCVGQSHMHAHTRSLTHTHTHTRAHKKKRVFLSESLSAHLSLPCGDPACHSLPFRVIIISARWFDSDKRGPAQIHTHRHM